MSDSIYRPRRLAAITAVACLGFAAQSQAQVGPLLWEDNFNTLNTDYWNVIEGDGCPGLCGWGNQELEYYQDDNVSIEAVPGESGNSAIVLEARNQSVESRAFTSGKLDSKNGVSVKYGMIETRIRVPNLDTGLWPAFWLLGTSTSAWPAKGEIDMMEMGHKQSYIDAEFAGANINNFVGSNAIFYADAACVPANPTCAASTAFETDNAYLASTSLADRFVTYRLYWTDQSLRFAVVDNGTEYDMYDSPIPVNEESSEFRQPFYLLMNLAIGGNFTDALQNSQVTAPLPAKMYIDYVRVYEYNGLGEVTLGNPSEPETGTFGVFSDRTDTSRSLASGETSDIYIWSTNSLAGGNEQPFEGSEVISWDYTTPGQWFGGGVQSRQPLDMSNFADGDVSFRIKVPANVGFRVGITDTYTNEHYIDFPAGEEKYGLVRNGGWSQVTIPVAELTGDLIALQSVSYPFAILSTATTPSSNVAIAIDDIVWQGGGDASTGGNDDDNDGVDNSTDQCPGTASGVQVNALGCATTDAQIEAEDYSNFMDADVGNNGGAYRTDDVDIEATTDNGGGFSVGWTTPGEWLEYDTNLAPGTYQVTARVASLNGGGQFTLSEGGDSVSANVAATGGWQTWETVNLGELQVNADASLRLDVQTGDFNLNWVRLEQTSGNDDGGDPTPPSGPYGVEQTSTDTLAFYVQSSSWADVHYSVNGGGQQNVRMTQASGENTYPVSGLSAGDTLSYNFTYWDADANMAVDTPTQTVVVQ